ncbi:MAG: hypothetical protein P8H65_10905 [Rhodothermales bacterium]|nr:hypothetical protein [Rhodothermales bacterium]MDG2016509.1 hypothetical protein [Rhodothermales bacterium]
MKYAQKVTDRQVGRNADLFAMRIGDYKTEEERYPFIRILISIIEQAHPEWSQAPNKDKQISHLVFHMSHGAVSKEETEKIVHLRDMERGFIPLPEKPKVEEEKVEAAVDDGEAAMATEAEPAADTEAEAEIEAEGEAPKKAARAKSKEKPKATKAKPKAKRPRKEEAPIEIEAATLFSDEDDEGARSGDEAEADEKKED